MLKAQKNYARLGLLGGIRVHLRVLILRQALERVMSLIWGHILPGENPPGLQDSARTKCFGHLLVIDALANCRILEEGVDLFPFCSGKKFTFSRSQVLQGNF